MASTCLEPSLTLETSVNITSEQHLRSIIGAPHSITATKKTDHLTDEAMAFLARSPFLIMTTVAEDLQLDASPKGDAPGFVRAPDAKTLIIPDRRGNKLADGHLNVLKTGRVGLIFLVPNTRETLRINGKARLTADPAALATFSAYGRPAVLLTEVSIEECFFHCGKALIRSKLWDISAWDAPGQVSFGKMLAQANGGDAAMAEAIDQSISDDYIENL